MKESMSQSVNSLKTSDAERPEDFKLSEDFSRCFNELEYTRNNVYITGEAGTGKTTLLKYFRQKTKKSVVVLAPTGIAAINCFGQTIHSFFHFPAKLIQKENIRRVRGGQKIFSKLDILIIDEASMMRADILDGIDEALRLNMGNENEPFGGVQVALIGDLYQLPPIIDRASKDIYTQMYRTPYFFSSKIYQQSPFKQMVLSKIYRQKDSDFTKILNQIRNKKLGMEEMKTLNARANQQGAVEDCITLTPTNAAAASVNDACLARLHAETFTYSALIEGEFDESSFPTDPQLKLKVGAQVLMLQNDPAKRWVNGSVGEVTRLEEDLVEVKIKDKKHEVETVRWRKIKYEVDAEQDKITEKDTGGFEQYPMKLAWAITIHKSQGLTFEKVIVDFGPGTFAHGQAYVALSRCRSLEGLILKRPLQLSDIIFDQRVAQYHNFLEEDFID